MIWQQDLFLCDSCPSWVQQDFLSLTLNGKPGDRPRKCSYTYSEAWTVTEFSASFGNRWASEGTRGNGEELIFGAGTQFS